MARRALAVAAARGEDRGERVPLGDLLLARGGVGPAVRRHVGETKKRRKREREHKKRTMTLSPSYPATSTSSPSNVLNTSPTLSPSSPRGSSALPCALAPRQGAQRTRRGRQRARGRRGRASGCATGPGRKRGRARGGGGRLRRGGGRTCARAREVQGRVSAAACVHPCSARACVAARRLSSTRVRARAATAPAHRPSHSTARARPTHQSHPTPSR